MTEDQLRALIRGQILDNFKKNIDEGKDSEKASFLTESDLRMMARSKLREASLKKKVLKNEE